LSAKDVLRSGEDHDTSRLSSGPSAERKWNSRRDGQRNQQDDGELVKRAGRFGEFVGCSRYPACDYIKDREERPAPTETGKACPTCGRPLVLRQSRRGPFVGCSGYPECRYTEQAEGGAPSNRPEPTLLDEACPVCGKPMVMRRGRFGEFKACSDYPRCKGPARTAAPGRKKAARK